MHVLNSIYWDLQYLAEYLFVTQESQDWKYHAQTLSDLPKPVHLNKI